MPRSSSGRTRPEPSNAVEATVRVPSEPPWAVSRTALVNRLRATSPSLVTLVAPAGYGKTTLAAQWAERERRPCAWLTVDESDDDPDVLLARLGDALERIRPDEGLPRAAARRARLWATELQRLASRLGTLGDFLLVVDDAQLLRSRNATKVLATLAEHVPAGSTLALAGRVAPALPIARLRADGRLLELGAAELELSRRESEALLRSLDAGLTDDDAAELLLRCEGWAAGIRLSALARRHAGGRDRPVPRGDDRFLAEYFRSEFLSPLTDELRAFLRRTSVLESLTAQACNAVLKRKDSGRVLASLERRHLLLAPLDRHGEAYRCHPLLRDLLARELAETEPELVVTLHRRAADSFEAHGDPESALGHAEASGDVDRSARIVAAIALPTYYRGRIAEVESWLGRFDEQAQLEQYPAVAVLGGWIHALGGRPGAAERWLAAAERGAALETAPGGDSVAPAISLLRAALCRDGVEQMCADIQSALGGLPPSSQWRPTALLLLGCTLVLRGQDALADAILAAAEESAERLDATDTLLVAISERSLLASARGEHELAEAHSMRARALAEEFQLDGYTTTALELAASARTSLRSSRWDDARISLASAHALTPRLTEALPWLAVQTRLELTRAYVTLRDAEAAQAVLSEVLEILRRRPSLGVLPEQASELQLEVEAMWAADERNGAGLTRAELRLLPLLATHLSFREIGARLYVSRNTVKTQAISVYRKLGVSSRSDAIDRAVRLGLVAAPSERVQS
jgi:LuxR family transcriptional regulator, maltose regulon positive regulatory protein